MKYVFEGWFFPSARGHDLSISWSQYLTHLPLKTTLATTKQKRKNESPFRFLAVEITLVIRIHTPVLCCKSILFYSLCIQAYNMSESYIENKMRRGIYTYSWLCFCDIVPCCSQFWRKGKKIKRMIHFN